MIKLRRRLTASDDGFTLVEAVVSLLVFALLSVGVAATLVNSLGTTRNNRQRVEAASLANRQLDIARSQAQSAKRAGNGCPACVIPDGQSGPYTDVVNGTNYQVVQTADFVQDNSTASACDSTTTGRLGYKRVTATVTWPNMRSTRPVRADTLVEIGVAGLDPSKGAVAVGVKDRDNNPVPAQTVTLNPGGLSQQTGDDGCAVFTGLDPAAGTYTISLVTPGYVDRTGTNPTSSVTSVTASQVSHVGFLWDRAATLTATYSPPQLPAGLPAGTAWTTAAMPLTLVNSGYVGGYRTYGDCSVASVPCASTATAVTAPRTVTPLFPSYAGYNAYLGPCADNRPSSYPVSAVMSPGGSGTTTVATGGVVVRAAAGTPVYAAHYGSDTACPGSGSTPGVSYLLGTVPANGYLTVLMPYGAWTFAKTAAGSGTSVTFTAAAPVQTVAVS